MQINPPTALSDSLAVLPLVLILPLATVLPLVLVLFQLLFQYQAKAKQVGVVHLLPLYYWCNWSLTERSTEVARHGKERVVVTVEYQKVILLLHIEEEGARDEGMKGECQWAIGGSNQVLPCLEL